MSDLGGLSGGIRFITYMPLFVLTFYAYPVYQSIQASPELYHAPYNSNIPLAAGCAGVAAIMGVIWTFITWIPSVAAKGIGAFVIGFVDGTITILLFIQFIIGATFIPLDGCKTHDMTTYGAPEGHKSIFLVVANQTVVNQTIGVGDKSNWGNGAKQASYDSCKDFLTIWSMSLALMVLFFAATICNVVLTFCDDYASGDRFARWRALAGAFRNWLIKWPWRHSYPRNTFGMYFILIFIDIPLFGPTLLLSLLPTVLHRWLWIAIRGAAKLSLTFWQTVTWGVGDKMTTRRLPQLNDAEQKKPLELKVLPKHRRRKSPSPPPAEKPPQPRTAEDRLANFLILDVLMLISRDLHFQDLINLSLTSRSMRQIIFPAGSEAKERWQLYKLYTCAPGSRRQCEGCTMQVCTEPGCGMQIYMTALDCSGHGPLMKHYGRAFGPCLPYCLKCWNETTNNDYESRERCLCMFNSTNLVMCTACSLKRGRDFTAVMRSRQEKILRKEKLNGVQCGKCRRVVDGIGPRWWVCTICQRECRCHSHPAWSWERKRPTQAGDAA